MSSTRQDNSLSSDRMLKLMAYADGELEGDERAEVERWLATDVDAARFTNEVAGLGDLVKVGYEGGAESKAVVSFDVADAVMAKVGASGETVAPSAKRSGVTKGSPVVSLEAARARRRQSFKVGGAVAAALALAASVFVMTRSKEEQPLAHAPSAPSSPASSEPGVDVDLVESAGDSVRVFYLSSESSPTTSVVVWVDESGGK